MKELCSQTDLCQERPSSEGLQGKQRTRKNPQGKKIHMAMRKKWNSKFVDGQKTVTIATMSTVQTAHNLAN